MRQARITIQPDVMGRAGITATTVFTRHADIIMQLIISRGHDVTRRAYSTGSFTHLDAEGNARMVDVGSKPVTSRAAAAQCHLKVSPLLLQMLKDQSLPKGDALAAARLAGVMAAKRTADFIPLCHPLPLDAVTIDITLPDGNDTNILVYCEVKVTSRTGAEMEALTGAALAALTLYDMCKAVDKNMVVKDLKVVSKSGGRSGTWPKKETEGTVKVREHDTTPIKPSETYAPTNFMNF